MAEMDLRRSPNKSPKKFKNKDSTSMHNCLTDSTISADSALMCPVFGFPTSVSIVFIAAVSCFLNSHSADFVFDDSEAIKNNRDIEHGTPLWDLFGHDFWGNRLASNSSHKSYRPLTVLTFRLNYFISGGRFPWGFHVTNIILHGCVSGIFTLAFSVFTSGKLLDQKGQIVIAAPKSAFLCGLLFAVHPIHTESVAAVVGRADLLCALTFLIAFLCYVRACCSGPYDQCGRPLKTSWPWILVSIVFCAMSVLFKEQGITVLGICSAFDVICICKIDLSEFFKRLKNDRTLKLPGNLCPGPLQKQNSPSHQINERQTPRQGCYPWIFSLFTRQVLLLAAGLVILFGRWRVMGSSPPVFQRVDNPHSFLQSYFHRMLNYNYIYSLNAWLLLMPWWLCFDWSMGCIPPIETVYDYRNILTLVFWLLVGALVYRCVEGPTLQEKRALMLALVVAIVTFLPASNVFFRVGFVIAERILYLPSAGFVMLIVMSFRNFSTTSTRKKIVSLLYIFIFLNFTIRSIQRSSQWRTERELFEAGALVCPSNAKVHYNIAKIYGDSGDIDRAIKKYKHSIELYPEYDQAMNNLGNILKDQGELHEAELLLEKATEIRPEFAAAWMNLGIVQAALLKNSSAEQSYKNALRHRQKYPDCFYNLGNLFLDTQRYQEALMAWRNATLLKPTHVSAWSNMILLLDNMGRIPELEIVAREVQEHLPNDASINFNIANALGKVNKNEASEMYFLKAIENSPNSSNYYSNLGVLYHRWGKLKKAKKYYETALRLDPLSKSTRENLEMLLRRMSKDD